MPPPRGEHRRTTEGDGKLRLVCCPASKLAWWFHLFESGVGGCGPVEGEVAGVVVSDEAVGPFGELLDRRECAAADGPLGDDAEPALDLVELGRIGRRVVDVVAGPLRQPMNVSFPKRRLGTPPASRRRRVAPWRLLHPKASQALVNRLGNARAPRLLVIHHRPGA